MKFIKSIKVMKFIRDFNNGFKNHMASSNLGTESLLLKEILSIQNLQ